MTKQLIPDSIWKLLVGIVGCGVIYGVIWVTMQIMSKMLKGGGGSE